MASIFGLNSSGDNNYFNSLSGLSSSNKSSNDSSVFSGMISGASALGDYSMIQNGTYKKLLNAYYNRNSSSTATETDKKEMINLNTANADASALNSSINKLMGTAVTEENRDTIKENIKSLVENYNSVIDSASEVDNTSVLRQALWMTQGTSANSSTLTDIGLSVGENNKLTFDEEKFDKADLAVMKSLFTGTSSFMGRLANRSSQIASAAINALTGSSGSAYNSSAGYTGVNSKSIIDTLT
ncbi:MAG: flagellar filament capping protein FliD [Lachnospiraceae bacterium]|nr:flagellar filament capping protein FliD [Lachnospiraceae bacterium]